MQSISFRHVKNQITIMPHLSFFKSKTNVVSPERGHTNGKKRISASFTATLRRSLIILSLATITLSSQAKGAWITADDSHVNDENTWIAFQKDVSIKRVPRHLKARIACDSKYWMWINGQLVVFEGELKRGPAPNMSYYDEVDIAPHLRKGSNRISILLCYFGKSAFSHASSGQSGLIIEADDEAFDTNSSWLSRVHPAYGTATGPKPNFRLSESNILFDARRDIADWQTANAREKYGFKPSKELGAWGDKPWGGLELRPIPMWKDFGVKKADFEVHHGPDRDTLVAMLPGDIQMTPIIDLTDQKGGRTIDIRTNHSYHGGTWNVRAQYITRQGRQSYESLGWMNGEKILLIVPKDITVNSIAYRETGYDTWVEGTFECDNDFWNKFWQKAMNTIYVNARDTYFDCPERERAQWWGDETTITGEAFYSYSRSIDKLMRKGLYELLRWQRDDGTIHAPVPGNYDAELPSQMLAAVSTYGLWNYYMNTADEQVIRDLYPRVKRYLNVYKLEANGFPAERTDAKWLWGDHGNNRDKRMIVAAWYSIALDAAIDMAHLLGLEADAEQWQATQKRVKDAYNSYWTGYSYRHPEYMDATDDRAQFLAVVAGIASPDKYEAISKVMKDNMFCSAYLETYALQAMFMMGRGAEGMKRTASRLHDMVLCDSIPTLWEQWGVDRRHFRGGSSNHAWTGGAVTIIARDLMGVRPTKPGYAEFAVNPQYVEFHKARLSFPTVRGIVATSFTLDDSSLLMTVTVPKTSRCLAYIPSTDRSKITVNGKALRDKDIDRVADGKTVVWLAAGEHKIEVKK